MPFANFGNPYQFDPQDFQNAGGLAGLLRDAIRRQALQLEELDTPSPEQNQSSNAGPKPQRWLGRLDLPRPPSETDESTEVAGAGLTAIPAQFRVPMPGRAPWPGYPLPPGPGSIPQIPMPHVPEPWPTIWKLMKILPGAARDLADGRDAQCPDCQEKEDSQKGGDIGGGVGRPPRVKSPPLAPMEPGLDTLPPVAKVPNVSRGGGAGRGGGRRRSGDDSECYEREAREKSNCARRKEEDPSWTYFRECLDRAGIRRDLCVRSKGRLDHEGPEEWGPGAEE